jgi:mannose/fructose-specific phosphotransferase system component IIA
MSEALAGVVVAHGALADALVAEVERISGVHGALRAVSNTGLGPADIEARILAAVGEGPAVMFVDMPCGSCFFAAMKLERARPTLRVVTGVNLAMLLDFVNNRALPASESAVRSAAKGAEAIRHP